MGRSDSFDISGAECVFALTRLGFDVVRRQAGATLLQRAHSFVIVPDVLRLSGRIVDRILDVADVSYAGLLAAIDDVPTSTEMRSVGGA